jgi:hypothetical protein
MCVIVAVLLVTASARPWSDPTYSIAAFSCIHSLLVSALGIVVGAITYSRLRRTASVKSRNNITIRLIAALKSLAIAFIFGIALGLPVCVMWYSMVVEPTPVADYSIAVCLQIIVVTAIHCAVIGTVFGAGLGQASVTAMSKESCS